MIIIFQTLFPEIIRAEDPDKRENDMEVVFVYQVEIDRGVFVGTLTGDTFISKTSAPHHLSDLFWIYLTVF